MTPGVESEMKENVTRYAGASRGVTCRQSRPEAGMDDNCRAAVHPVVLDRVSNGAMLSHPIPQQPVLPGLAGDQAR